MPDDTECTCPATTWRYDDPAPMPDEDCPQHGNPAVTTSPDDTTSPVAAEGLRERLTEAARRWALMNPIAAWYGDGPRAEKLAKIWGEQIARVVLAELIGDPGDLPGQIEAALRSTWDGTPTHMDDAIRAEVKAVMPVFIEHTVQLAAENAQLRAERDHAVGELSARRDHETRWETEKARADKAETERDAANLVIESLKDLRDSLYTHLDSAQQRAEAAEVQVAALREELAKLKAADLRNRAPNNPPCPRCGSTHIISPMARLPWRRGQWWRCYGCFNRWSTDLNASPPEEIRRLAQATESTGEDRT